MKKAIAVTVPEKLEKQLLDGLPRLDECLEISNDFPKFFTPWCSVPTDVVKNIFQAKYPDRMKDADLMAAILAWRRNKIIYQFDDMLAEKLAVDRDIDIPVEVIQHAPYQCVFIQGKLPNMPAVLETTGAFFMLDYKHKYPDKTFIKVVYCFEYVGSSLCVEYEWTGGQFDGNHTIKAFVSEMLKEDECESDDILFMENAKRVFQRHLNLFLYLCSEEPDIEREAPKPRVNGQRITQRAVRADVVHVGRYIGAVLKKARDEASDKAASTRNQHVVSPHMRRAHWHLYWTGREKKTPILRWLMPIFVNGRWADCVPTSLHGVE